MKPEKLNVEPAEKPLTRLGSALAAYDVAVSELVEHRNAMAKLRTRINELGAAIRQTNEKASKQPSLATLTLDQIRALSASKSAEFAELSGLNAALDVASVELRSMESDERGHRLLLQDSKLGAWAALYSELKATLDLDLLTKVLTAGLMAGMTRKALCDDILGESDAIDAALAESLGQFYGLPL